MTRTDPDQLIAYAAGLAEIDAFGAGLMRAAARRLERAEQELADAHRTLSELESSR